MYPSNIPAEPDKPRQDPGETVQKISQSLVREGPQSLRNRSGTLPERARANKTQKNDFLGSKVDAQFFQGAVFGEVFNVVAGPGARPQLGAGAWHMAWPWPGHGQAMA